MNTPDGRAPGVPATPGELSLVSTAPANLQAAPSPPHVSPGVSAGVLRVPTAPTLPEPDPANVLLAITRVANDLFSTPVGGPSASSPSLAVPSSLPASPTSVPASPPAGVTLPLQPTPPSSPASSSPFEAAPNFGALFGDGAHEPSFVPQDFSVPLLDAAPPALPSSPPSSPPVPSTTPMPPSTTLTAPQTSALATSPAVPATPSWAMPHEHRPLVDTGLVRSSTGFDAHQLKREFPILQERVHGKPLVWLDNAATTQKPRAVIDRVSHFYEHENSNIHRAAHTLAARATDAYEAAREAVRRFVNASSVRDVVFVRGTTEGINLVAQTWGRVHVGAGDEIVVTNLEHHANIVPWQLLAKEKGAKIVVVPVDDDGQIKLDDYERLLNERTKIVSMTQVSNALGTITPAQQMLAMAKRRGITTLLDGAQSVSHMKIDLQQLQPDFFVFSGHKIFGPTGIGAVVAPAALLDTLPPWQGGGNMIADVTFEHTRFHPAPNRFEAGTGNIADAVGLGAALDWVTRVGIENIGRHEHALLEYGTERLLKVPGLRMIGTAKEKAGVLSFVVAGHDTHALSSALDKDGVAVRGGHHCAQPIMRRMGVETTVRASLAPYNTTDDLDVLVDALCRLVT